jgi:hypothetical protein
MPVRWTILAGIVLALLAAPLSAQNPGTATLLQREVGRALERLGATDAFARRMRQAGTSAAALQLGSNLAHRGIGRLDTPTLQVRAEVLNQLFASADVATCAQWSRGILDPARALALLNSLDSITTSRWGDVSARAMVAEMNAAAPTTPPTPTEAREAFAAAASVMNSADQARYRDLLPRLASAPDADMCWFSRAVYASVLRLPAARRATTLNVFARLESQ